MWSQLTPIGDMRWACPDCKGELTANQISRYNARAKPLIVRPRKNAKDYIQTPIYTTAEAATFNFIAQVAPAGERDGANDPLAAAWAAIYMADILLQDKRPNNWERTATTTIQRCLTYLSTKQAGAGLIPAAAISEPWYGGITSNTDVFVGTEFTTTTWSTPLTIAAGIAWLKAYSALGTASYLESARKCATYIRHAQCGHLQATRYTVYPSGGGRYYIGGLADSIADFTGISSPTYNIADVLGAWFLSLLSAVDDGRLYGDAAATGYFSAPTVETIANMIANLTAFAETGARDGGVIVCPLSSTAPRLSYAAAQNGVGGAAAWTSPAEITARDMAHAILGVYEASGTTAKVAEMMAWLSSFSSNANNRTPASLREDLVVAGITGTYDPSLCPADRLSPSAPFVESDGALYDWASFGMLSPILAGNQNQMRTSKDTLATSVRYSFYAPDNVYLGTIGSSGLSLQPIYRSSSGALIGPGSAGGVTGTTSATPPMAGLVFWVKGDAGLESSGGLLTAWRDQGPLHQDLDTTDGNAPSVGGATINGIPAVSFPLGSNSKYIRRTVTMKDRNGAPFTASTPRTVLAIFRPKTGNVGFLRTGGPVFSFRETPCFQCLFSLESFFHVNGFYWFDNAWPFSGAQLLGPDTASSVYANTVTMAMWTGNAATGSTIGAAVNGNPVVLTPSTSGGVVGAAPPAGFMLGNADNNTGTPQVNIQGDIAEVLVWDYIMTGSALDQATGYGAARGGLAVSSSAPSTVVRAARAGMAYRQDPGRYPLARGN